MKWRLLLDGPGAPALNMAVDEALLREVKRPVLRIYGWEKASQSIGYFRSWKTASNPLFVRRYTGGGLVEHGRDVTYTVILPRAHAWMRLSAPESYSRIHMGICTALQRIGFAATLAAAHEKSESEACFEKAVRHDVTVDGRKVAGAAQRRTREGLMQQGSILLPDPKRNEDLARILPQAMGERLDFDWALEDLSAAEVKKAGLLEKERYGVDAWNRLK